MWKDFSIDDFLSSARSVIWVPNKDDAVILMDILHENGVTWCSGAPADSHTNWEKNKEETCYFVDSEGLSYCGRGYVMRQMEYLNSNKYDLFLFHADDPIQEVSEDEIAILFS